MVLLHCRSCDFLPKAFSLFPDFDFIVVTVPHLVPIFPLIQNFVVSVVLLYDCMSVPVYLLSLVHLWSSEMYVCTALCMKRFACLIHISLW